MEIGTKVIVNAFDNDEVYVIVDTTQDREDNVAYILADYETDEELDDVYYGEELTEVE